MCRSIAFFAVSWMPGVSTMSSCVSSVLWMPSSECRVVCGLREVIESLRPSRWFSSVDLPTLALPTSAT